MYDVEYEMMNLYLVLILVSWASLISKPTPLAMVKLGQQLLSVSFKQRQKGTIEFRQLAVMLGAAGNLLRAISFQAGQTCARHLLLFQDLRS
jgi:hypothetical protein